jgi:hypothetical protein
LRAASAASLAAEADEDADAAAADASCRLWVNMVLSESLKPHPDNPSSSRLAVIAGILVIFPSVTRRNEFPM